MLTRNLQKFFYLLFVIIMAFPAGAVPISIHQHSAGYRIELVQSFVSQKSSNFFRITWKNSGVQNKISDKNKRLIFSVFLCDYNNILSHKYLWQSNIFESVVKNRFHLLVRYSNNDDDDDIAGLQILS